MDAKNFLHIQNSGITFSQIMEIISIQVFVL